MDNATMTPDGLRMMDIEQVNEYLEHLMKGKASVGSELEQSALGHFKRISGRVDQLHSALGRAKAQVESFTAEVNSANGELRAYANMLASAEDARRVRTEAEEKAKVEPSASVESTEPEPPAPTEPELVKTDQDTPTENREAVA